MSHFKGVVPGVVKSLKDQDGLGRIQVHLPRLPGENRTFWASVAAPMAGKGRGFFFQPEVDDEVLLAFEEGDPQHPYIIGFMWNGVDKPPETELQNRVIVTPGGHTVRFEDKQGSRRIIIRSSGGLHLTLDDTDKSISLEGGGRKLKMHDDKFEIT